MSKVKLLSIISVCLLALNLFLIGVLLLPKPNVRKEGSKKIIIQKLHFDEGQTINH